MTHEKEGDMISIHDILAFIEYEKYFCSVERAKKMKARVAAPQQLSSAKSYGPKTHAGAMHKGL